MTTQRTSYLKRVGCMLLICLLLPVGSMAKSFYAVSQDGQLLTFYYDDNKSSRPGTVYTSRSEWSNVKESVTIIAFDYSVRDYRPTSCSTWFEDFEKLKSVQGLSNLNTSEVTSTTSMFADCKSLTKIDLSGLRMDNVVSMSQMFVGCSALVEVNMNFATATDNLEVLYNAFGSCSKLETLTGLDKLHTQNVTDMSYMFQECKALKTLDLSGFDGSSVKTIECMFLHCSSLQTVDLRNFDPKQLNNYTYVFNGCSDLVAIYCNSKWTNGASSKYSFVGCSKLCGGNGFSVKDDHEFWQHVCPDMPPYTGYFTATEGLFYKGQRITAANAGSLASSGTITYAEEDGRYVLTMTNATIKGEEGVLAGGLFCAGTNELMLQFRGTNTIETYLDAISAYDFFPVALTDGSTLNITSWNGAGVHLRNAGTLDDEYNSHSCTLNIKGSYYAIYGREEYNLALKKNMRPRFWLEGNDMVLNLSTGSDRGPVVSGIGTFDESNIAYSYDTYYFNDEKGAVYDCGVRPGGDGEGVVVTKPFKIVPKSMLQLYDVNLGGCWLNNYNADDFNPMSLTSGKVRFVPGFNTLSLEDASFSTPYIPYDEVYALYAETNIFLCGVRGTNDLTGIDDDYAYGIGLYEKASENGSRNWVISGVENTPTLRFTGDLYCQSLGDENAAQLVLSDIKIVVPDQAYFWQEDDVDVRIADSELDLTCTKWPDQTIVEYLNSLTLEDCYLYNGYYFDPSSGSVMTREGKPAKGNVTILRGDGPTPPPVIKRGDVTGDGEINTTDVVAIYVYIILGDSSGIDPDRADVNGNNDINSADVVELYNIIINGKE